MSSMQKLLDRNHELTLFTSISKVETQGREALSSCLEYLNNLDSKANKLYLKEGLNAEQIVDKVFGGESSLAELTDNQFAAKHLISSLLKN